MSSSEAPSDNPTSTKPKDIRVDLAFQGGGVLGIALVGALCALDDNIKHFYPGNAPTPSGGKPYSIEDSRVVGTSAGSIVAALLAARYKPSEIRDIVFGPDIGRLTDVGVWDRIPVVGKPLGALFGLGWELGAFRGDYFLNVMRQLLAARNIRTFKDLIVPGRENDRNALRKYRLHCVASDITHGRMLVLPNDMSVEEYGVAPDDLEVALAVRMSVSVPFFFRPVKLTGENGVTSYIVDGGLISNFPIEVLASLDSETCATNEEQRSMLGIRLISPRYTPIFAPFQQILAALAIAVTALQANDLSNAARASQQNTALNIIDVDTSAVSVLNFALTSLQKQVLYDRGYAAMDNALRIFINGRKAESQKGPVAQIFGRPASP